MDEIETNKKKPIQNKIYTIKRLRNKFNIINK